MMHRTIVVYAVINSAIVKSIPKNAKVGLFPLHLDPPTVYHQQLFKALVVPLAADDAMGKIMGGSKFSTTTYNPNSTTTSPYGDDWDTTTLSRYARRKRLLALLRDYKELSGGGSGGNSVSLNQQSTTGSPASNMNRSNRNYGNYVNTTKKDTPLRAVLEELTMSNKTPSSGKAQVNLDALSEDEIIAELKNYVVTSWASSSKGARNTSYGGLATALRDEVFLDSHSFGTNASDVERELLELLQEQHYINEEAYHMSYVNSENGGEPDQIGSRRTFTIFSPYDASQAHSKQLLQRRRLPNQTASAIEEESRNSIAGSSLAPFDHLIVLPNSKYPAPMQQSRHLAAMASLCTRGLHPRVHMELYSLEHPEHNDTVMRDLTQYFTNCTIIHWLPNISDVQMWRGYTDMMEKVPMLVLRPRGYHFFNQSVGSGGAGSHMTSSSSLSPSGSSSKKDESKSAAANAPIFRFSHRSVPTLKVPEDQTESDHKAVSDAIKAEEVEKKENSVELNLPNADSSSNSTHKQETDKKEESTQSTPTTPPSSSSTNTLMARALKSRLNAKQIEIVEVERLSGAGVRQLLWDRGTRHEEHGVIPPLVLRYMDSHGLYRDFRKGFAQSEQSLLHHQNSTGKIATSSFQATVALASLIPRLEIHYDRNNLFAREQYERLRNFECGDGQEPDLIVPIGGDGYMMHCIRQNWHRFIPFFGVNAGHRGYLLNEPKRLEELFAFPLKLYHMPMLYCEAEVAVLSKNSAKPGSTPMSQVKEKMEAALRPSMTGSNKKIVDSSSPSETSQISTATSETTTFSGSGSSFLMDSTNNAAATNTDSTNEEEEENSSTIPNPYAMSKNHQSPIFSQGEAAMGEAANVSFEKNVTFETRTELAFNDAWIDRATGQTAWLRVIVNNTQQLKCVRGDGVLVSTAAGSTAYAQALGASPIPADVQLIQLVGSNVVSPSRWRPVHLNQSDSVTLEVIDMEKRPCKCFVDSNCLGYARSLKVRTSRVASVQLAFCHSYDLQQKLYQVQFPKEEEW